MRTLQNKNNTKGFSLIEVLIACSVISIAIFSLMSASSKGIQLSNEALRQTQASFILEEGAEAVKSIRDAAWTNISSLTAGTNYYLTYNTGTNTWSLGTTPTGAIDSIFTRVIVISAVSRNGTDDIVTSGGTYDDTGTKKVTVTVSWPASDETISSKTLSFYISDIFS